MQALILGFAAVVCYGFYVGVKSMLKLFQAGPAGKKIFWGYLIFFLIAPCIFTGGYYIIDESNPNVWLVAPLALLAFCWLIMGFFIQSAYHNLDNKHTVVKTKEKAKNWMLIGISMFFIGFIVWLVGFFNGYLTLPGFWEDSLLVLSIYLILHGALLFYRNLSFLKMPQQPTGKSKKQQKTTKK